MLSSKKELISFKSTDSDELVSRVNSFMKKLINEHYDADIISFQVIPTNYSSITGFLLYEIKDNVTN